VLTEHVGDKNVSAKGELGIKDTKIHRRDMDWLTDADTVVAEVTTPSSGVGYEIGRIVERNLWVLGHERKNILCLYRRQTKRRLSAMIRGNDGVSNVEYTNLEEAKAAIDEFFKSLDKTLS
jgi:nucleoside 2-deoxyribosyltransferase